jgi:membrane protease subunit (stomatin/prohibitin family)
MPMEHLWQAIRREGLDVVEWADDGSLSQAQTVVWRFDRHDNALKLGSQLVVREGQWAVFVKEGRIADSFGPGLHVLASRNLPILTSLLSLPFGGESPFKAEVYFVATRLFTDLKWGTRHPLIVRDPELGPVRLRGFGSFTLRVNDPSWLIREVTGNRGQVSLETLSEQLRNLIVSRLADALGQANHSILDLAGRYDELARDLRLGLLAEVQELGLEIPSLLIENLTLPADVEAALDRRSGRAIGGEEQAVSGSGLGIAGGGLGVRTGAQLPTANGPALLAAGLARLAPPLPTQLPAEPPTIP